MAHSIDMDILPYGTVKKVASNRSSGEEKSKGFGKTRNTAYDLFSQGFSLEDVGEYIHRPSSTVLKYLIEYLTHKNIHVTEPWVDKNTFEEICKAATETGSEQIKSIYNHLKGEVSYNEIKICLTCLKNQG